MDLYEAIDHVAALLEQRGRVAYRAIKYQFDLDDKGIEALKDELIDAQQVAIDEGGKVLVWTGAGGPTRALLKSRLHDQTPASYTPQYIADRIRAEKAAMDSRGLSDGERKTITALFADLKDSTALIERLDPEEARAIVDPALQLMMDAVHCYEGYVAQSLGDGIFALFGAPIAHEDHPQRALYAALRMQEDMKRYSESLPEDLAVPIQMRVGVNTGEVVLRSIHKDDLHADYVPVGHSTNIAARIEQLANPGSILITEQTHKLTGGYFNFKPLGKTEIKGIEEPVPIYEVIGASPHRTRFQVSARRARTSFVGRRREMDQLRQTLEQAKAGQGQIVGVMGEPGLGKSRLFYEFKRKSQNVCLVLEAFSVSYGKVSPYLPIVELLKTYFLIQPQDEEWKRKEKISNKVLSLDRSLEETLPYLYALLGIDGSDPLLQQFDAQTRRRRTFEALKKLFLRESQNQPLIFIFEDLHWIDANTERFLDTFSKNIASARILLLVNYRPEYRCKLKQESNYTHLRLSILGKKEAEKFLTFLMGNNPSLTELKMLILEKTEGTPFFMEEVVQTLVEGELLRGEPGDYYLKSNPTELHIPPTVQGVLAARIDRLSIDEKELLHQLSVIGRQFPVDLVKEIVFLSEAELYRLLASLKTKEFLYEQPGFPEVEYLFKHALSQEVAYSTVLQEQRKLLHERTAMAMEALYHSSLEDHYNELAHHYSRSINTKKAVIYLGLAGQQAIERSAHKEAIRYLNIALDLLKRLPDTPDRTQHELTLRIAQGVSLMATKGWAAPEVEHAYARAKELCQQVGEISQLFEVVVGLWTFYLGRAELPTARDLAEDCLKLAQQTEKPGLLLEAHHALACTYSWSGELVAALKHLEQVDVLYSSHEYSSHGVEDLKVVCLCHRARILWQSGYPQQARKMNHEAFSLAQKLSHPASQAFALGYTASYYYQPCGEIQGVIEQTEALIELSSAQAFKPWVAWSRALQGWALAKQGDVEGGIVVTRQGLADYQAAGSRIGQTYCIAILAEMHGKLNQIEAGLGLLNEGLELVNITDERFYEAELYRLKGELTIQSKTSKLGVGASLTSTGTEEAKNYFQKALEVARQQHARAWELRAATSLARLWQKQGKKTEAHQLLAEIYNWFTEGHETADLKDAKTLLLSLVS